MKLIRYSQPQMMNDWDGFFADPFRAFAPFFRTGAGDAGQVSQDPGLGPVEWYEDDDHYHVRIELPGVVREQLKVDAEDGNVRLSFEAFEQESLENGETTREKRFERVLRIPEGVELGGISARLADGILDLTLPKADERKPVSVAVA